MMNKPTQNLSLRTHHPKSEIRNSQSDPPHPQSDIRNPTSDIEDIFCSFACPFPLLDDVGSKLRNRLCKKAAEAGCEYLALTDTNGLYGLIHFLEAARQYGIRPIVGAHLQINCHAVGGAPAGNPSTRDSSLITHHSSLITHHSSLITHHSSLITHHSSLITHHSSLITHHSRGYPGQNPKRL